MLTWIFGAVQGNILTQYQADRAAGELLLEKADVSWFLSINAETLPNEVKQLNKRTYRTLTIDDEEIEFSDGFTDLHTESYRQILAGNGFGLNDARTSVQIVHDIRKQTSKF